MTDDSEVTGPVAAGPAPDENTDESTDTATDRVELNLPDREPTGDDAVDGSLQQLDEVRGRGLQEHLEAAEKAQESLQQRLADTGE